MVKKASVEVSIVQTYVGTRSNVQGGPNFGCQGLVLTPHISPSAARAIISRRRPRPEGADELILTHSSYSGLTTTMVLYLRLTQHPYHAHVGPSASQKNPNALRKELDNV